MTATPSGRLRLAAAGTAQAKSPEHKKFQTLLARIEKARERLAAWQREAPVFAQMHAKRVAPVLAELKKARRAWAFELEGQFAAHRWSKTDAQTMAQMICDLCVGLLDEAARGDTSDDELKALHDRHAEIDYDSASALDLQNMKVMFEEMSGLELGDEPIESEEELMRRAHAKMGQRVAAEDAPGQDSPRHFGAGGAAGHKRKAARSPRKSATEKRAEEDAQRISQTVREVYRRLASALHPDRIPANTPTAEREARTASMQRANTAYEAGDLLALLELQLQIEQVDMAHAAGVAAEQVRHFNKVLAEQLRELDAEIDGRQQALCMAYGLFVGQRLEPTKLGALIQDELAELAEVKGRLEFDRRVLRAGPPGARRLLKQWRAEQQMLDSDMPF